MAKEPKSRLFDFGLTEAEEERAARLHKESITINMLSLGPVGPKAFTDDMIRATMDDFERHRNLKRTRAMTASMVAHMAVKGQFPPVKEWWDISGLTACNLDPGLQSMEDFFHGLSLITLQFDHFDWLLKVKNTQDIRRAKAEGKHAAFINAQHIEAIGQDLDNLDILSDFGLKVLQLAYNSMNYVAGGCTERTDAGVSSFGARVIERMDTLGIIVDTSHCGHQSTMDACALSRNPVIASHTAAKGVYTHDRGKADEALAAIAKTGGVIGVCILPFFISGDDEVTLECFLDHIDYIVKLAGFEHVGIGTDAPFSLPEWEVEMGPKLVGSQVGFRPEHRLSAKSTKGYEDARDFINITRGLVSRGYSDDQIKAILGENWLRLMDAVWK